MEKNKNTQASGDQAPNLVIPVSGRLAAFLFLGFLMVLGFLVLRNFIVPLVWAGILTYVSWPLHRWIHARLGDRNNLSAFFTTLLLAFLIVLPLVFGGAMLADELTQAYQAIRQELASDSPQVPEALKRIPLIGERLQEMLSSAVSDPEVIRLWLSEYAAQWIKQTREILGAIGRNTFKLSIALLALFFFLRDGEHLAIQMRAVLQHWLGKGAQNYWLSMTDTTRSVVFGLVLTALAQGVLAGLCYWVAGVSSPVLFGAFTALLALVPFGAPVVWGSVGIWLLLTGSFWPGIGVLLWGALVVSMIDNIIRPIAISSSAKIPFMAVFIGVLGGFQAFGMVGLFVGPVILSVMLVVWREWLETRTEDSTLEKVD